MPAKTWCGIVSCRKPFWNGNNYCSVSKYMIFFIRTFRWYVRLLPLLFVILITMRWVPISWCMLFFVWIWWGDNWELNFYLSENHSRVLIVVVVRENNENLAECLILSINWRIRAVGESLNWSWLTRGFTLLVSLWGCWRGLLQCPTIIYCSFSSIFVTISLMPI